MPRYIDSDWIYQMVENRYRVSSGIEHRCERDLLDLICQAPTADVVPKSEVEKEIKNWQELYADTVSKWEKAYEELEIKLENAKAEVAREIFEEIKKITARGNSAAEFWDSWFCKYAELKKKYTEGE